MHGLRSLNLPLEEPIEDPESVLRRKNNQASTSKQPEFFVIFDESPKSFSEDQLNLDPFANMGDADTQAIGTFSRATNQTAPIPAIILPPIADETKVTEIRGYIYNRLPEFNGLSNENPYDHLNAFNSVIEDIHNLTNKDRVLLTLFPKTLKDKAKAWLNMLPARSITTFAELSAAFLKKYFPIGKTQEIRHNIMTFNQGPSEEFHECWERYQQELLKCPHHQFPSWQIVQIFYNALDSASRSQIDSASGGRFLDKDAKEAKEILNALALNSADNVAVNRRGRPNLRNGMFAISQEESLEAKFEALSQKFNTVLDMQTKFSKFVDMQPWNQQPYPHRMDNGPNQQSYAPRIDNGQNRNYVARIEDGHTSDEEGRQDEVNYFQNRPNPYQGNY